MADDLKKIGLVFKADGTADFKKSLTQINALTKENYASFKLAQSQYDKTTSSVEKLKNQQNYLTKNTELYRNKVEILKDELDQLESSENKNEKAISNKKKQIANVQTTLANYEKGLKEINDKLESGSAQLDEYAEKISNVSKKTTEVGKSLSKNLTAPIVAVGTASMVAWNEIDEAYDNIILKTGATGKSLDGLKDSFDNVYGSMPVESKVVSEAIGEVNTRFKVTGKELEDLSKYMIQYAEITGSDVTKSTAYAQKIQGQWNLSIEDTKNVLGMLAKKSQDTGIDIETLMSSVTNNSSTFKEMNLSVEESIELMAQFESNGLDADTMMTGLKKSASNYAKEGKSMSEGLSDLISRLQDSTTYQSAYNEAIDLFGTKNALAFATAAREGKINLSNLSSSLDEYSDVVKNTFEGTLDPADKAKNAFHNIKIIGSDLAETIQGALAPVLENVLELLKRFSEWFKSLNPEIKTTIVIIAGLVASIGPLLVIVGTMGTQIANAISLLSNLKLIIFQNEGVIQMMKVAISGLSGTMIATIGIIALISAAVIDLWKNNESFRKNVISIVNNIASIIKIFYNSILKPIIDAMILLIKTIWDSCLKPLYENVRGFINEVINITSQLLSFLTPVVNTIVNLLGNILTGTLMNVLLPIFNSVFSAIGNIVSICFKTIEKIYNSVLKPAFDLIITGARGLKDSVETVFNGISSTATTIWNGIKSAITNPMESAKKLVKGIIDSIKGFFDFKISWPKIPLPHFSIKPKNWGIGDLLKGKIPSLGISWYAKAMDTPMLLDRATIFGSSNGNLMGGGEKGREYISGEKGLKRIVSEVIESSLQLLIERQMSMLEIIIELMKLILEKNQNIVLDDGTLIGKIIDEINKELYLRKLAGERGL